MFSLNIFTCYIFSLKNKYGQILKFKPKACNSNAELSGNAIDQPQSKLRKKLER